MCKLKIAGIENDSITDGPGIRYTIFTQGCPHRCKNCHNPNTHDYDSGSFIEINDLLSRICKNPLLTGVTFSGGEPFIQAKPLIRLAEKIKAQGLELAIYTGYTIEELFLEADRDKLDLLKLADTIIDGRYMESEKSFECKFKGSKNQRIVDVKATLKNGTVVLDKSERWN